LDAIDLLTENQDPIAPTRPRSVYFDVVVEAKKPGFDADSFRLGLQEALVQDPDLLALGRRQGGFSVCSQTGRAGRCWSGYYFEVNEG